MLKVLDLKGCIVTIAAMGCQKDIAKGIVARKADYVLAVKGNQENLHKAVLAAFAKLDAAPEAVPHFMTEAAESGHGRLEYRRATAVEAMQHLPDEILFLWSKLETLVRIQTQTERATKRSIRHRRLKAALSQEYRLAARLGFPAGNASEGRAPVDQKTMPPSSRR